MSAKASRKTTRTQSQRSLSESSQQKAKRSPQPPGSDLMPRLSAATKIAAIVVVAVVALAAIFYLSNRHNGGSDQAGQYSYQVGQPGPGFTAPSFKLPATSGGKFSLSSMRGKTVLLYFQEGVTCQPCWDQITDIESRKAELSSLGIDQMVSITTDPMSALKQKVSDERISMAVLSDANLAVSQSYSANSYGMMGHSRDGHTFVVVGPNGKIEWRADYGGAPDYTMFVPVSNLVADIRKGLKST